MSNSWYHIYGENAEFIILSHIRHRKSCVYYQSLNVLSLNLPLKMTHKSFIEITPRFGNIKENLADRQCDLKGFKVLLRPKKD